MIPSLILLSTAIYVIDSQPTNTTTVSLHLCTIFNSHVLDMLSSLRIRYDSYLYCLRITCSTGRPRGQNFVVDPCNAFSLFPATYCNKGTMSRAAAASQFNATVGGCRPESSARFNALRCFLSQKHAHTRLSQKYVDTKNMNECNQTTVPALEAIRGHRSAHSFATGPVMAEPFISPLGFTMTPALSSK